MPSTSFNFLQLRRLTICDLRQPESVKAGSFFLTLLIISLSCLVQTYDLSLSGTVASLDHCSRGPLSLLSRVRLCSDCAPLFSLFSGEIIVPDYCILFVPLFTTQTSLCRTFPVLFPQAPYAYKYPLPSSQFYSSSRINSNNSHNNSLKTRKLNATQIKPQQEARKSSQTCTQSTTSSPFRALLFSPPQPRGTW